MIERLLCWLFGCRWQSTDGVVPDYCDRCGNMDIEDLDEIEEED